MKPSQIFLPTIDEMDRPHSNCGVVGVYGHPQAAVMVYYALHALQHRGQEAAGIVAARRDPLTQKVRFYAHRDKGLVLEVFSNPAILKDHLAGSMAIGHNRYSTTGGTDVRANIQPFAIRYRKGNLALSNNGNLTNTRQLREQLQQEGAIFQSSTDTEIFLHLIARSRAEDPIEQILEALRTVRGAYALVMMTDTQLLAARDPYGIRPLAIGRIPLETGKWAYIVASETCAFDIIGAEYVRDVRHNELIVIDQETLETGTIHSFSIQPNTPTARHCIFEYVYFARPDSTIFGHSVDKVRRRLGKRLAEEAPVYPSDEKKVVVMGVPDSANTASLGYAQQLAKQEIPSKYEIGLIRSHYIGRTFIAPGQDAREIRVKAKFNPVAGVLRNRTVVMVDDSIVRGTTAKALVQLVRSTGLKELHLRISSPPVRFPCHYGMDFPSYEELIANHFQSDQQRIGQELGADSLHYLSLQGLHAAVPQEEGIGYCDACFTGNYPVPIEEDAHKDDLDVEMTIEMPG